MAEYSCRGQHAVQILVVTDRAEDVHMMLERDSGYQYQPGIRTDPSMLTTSTLPCNLTTQTQTDTIEFSGLGHLSSLKLCKLQSQQWTIHYTSTHFLMRVMQENQSTFPPPLPHPQSPHMSPAPASISENKTHIANNADNKFEV